eukprot:CAMPEP_0174754864 /NCGR_PEP_ID=MMETSP1094-20130205/105956_1 /TAXON_ID=156173 /ORGANISM="Chrysochromulina brevifilum, Strain UTEX LB 985" /LENGTH=118 /DNA_ID=CAMNT_0015960747 /DNA_START=71 /DNA_END=427 /DNA_ORIENTATION=+
MLSIGHALFKKKNVLKKRVRGRPELLSERRNLGYPLPRCPATLTLLPWYLHPHTSLSSACILHGLLRPVRGPAHDWLSERELVCVISANELEADNLQMVWYVSVEGEGEACEYGVTPE